MSPAPAQTLTSASTPTPHRDWSVALGSGRLQPLAYPAKWQADPTAAPSCTADYVIYGLNVAGVTGGQPSIVGLNRLYSDPNLPNPLCPLLQPNFLFSCNTNTIANGRILNTNISGGTDFFFWGVSRSCPGFGAPGCVVSLTNAVTQSTAKVNGGTSGIIIDNNYVTQNGGSSIYFSSGAVPNNAVKVTQQGLQ
jgi:hypothetical protein